MPPNTIDIENFAQDWVARNVRPLTGLASVPAEIDRLAADLTRAARVRGITGRDLHRALGDIDDYLGAQYRRICGA